MSKARFTALLGLVESEDEDTSEILESATQSKQLGNMAPAKKGRAAATNRVTKPAPTATRQTAGRTGRPALAEKTVNVQQQLAQGRGKKRPAADEIDLEEAPENDGVSAEGESKPKGSRGRPRRVKTAKTEDDATQPAVEDEPEPTAQPARRGRKPKAQVATPPIETEIPETQEVEPEAEVLETQQDEAMYDSIDDDHIEGLPPYSRTQISSVQRPQRHAISFSASRRPTAASDSELNDPSMRRRIGDLTRKYETLEAKYRDLREIGVKEAERNYDRLKKQGEERANTANQLIATLKAQLSAQTELAKEGQRVKQNLGVSEGKLAGLQSKVAEMAGALAESKIEIKTLTTKLAASRATETANAKVPGSAVKGNSGHNRLLANAESAAQLAQMKENLYSDLTGMIIRGVKREDIEVYDCIQTGRNGTLHFKLSISPDETSENIDEAQFMYMPQLDPNRDRDLIEIMPDYLVEDITFPRSHAARFYARVSKSLTERSE